jgi:hypothetical protein
VIVVSKDSPVRKENRMEFQSERAGTSPFVRVVLGLTAAAVAVGALAMTPAGAAKFLTKKKAERRYLGNTTVATNTVTVPDQDGATITVPCPAGLQAVGGGADSPEFNESSSLDGVVLLERKPQISGGRSVAWITEVVNVSDGPVQVTAHAVCSP